MGPVLRPYQHECVEACLAAFARGIRRQAVSLPVGSGKTVIFSHLLERVPPPSSQATKTLVLAHREELLDQAAARISAIHPHLVRSSTLTLCEQQALIPCGQVVDVDQGRRTASQLADVIIASIPTLGRQGSRRLQQYDPSRFKAVVVDEAHHVAASSYLRVLDHFDARSPSSRLLLWGCSATLRRHDGLGLGKVFEAITFHRNMLELMSDGYLAPMRVFTVRTQLDLSRVAVSSSGGLERDFVLAQLAAAVNTPARNRLVVEQWRALSAGQRRATLVFAVDVQHIQDLCEAFRAAGVAAEGIDGRTPTDDRADRLRRFASGELPVLVNCGVLTEGTDIPAVDCVVMARPTRSSVLFQQMVGRGLRTAPGKRDCLVIDLVDSFRHKSFITAPSLLGLDPDVILNGATIGGRSEAGALAARADVDADAAADTDATASPRAPTPLRRDVPLAATVAEIDPFAASDPPRLAQLSALAWMRFADADGRDEYLLAADGNTTIVVRERTDGAGGYRVLARRLTRGAGGKSFYRVQELPVTALTAEDAIRSADTYVQHKFGELRLSYLRRDARWRNDPASKQQVAYLRRLGVARFRTEEQLAHMTKDEAARIIAGITSGHARRAFRDAERERREQTALRVAQARLQPQMDHFEFGDEQVVWLDKRKANDEPPLMSRI